MRRLASKIKSRRELESIVSALRIDGRKIVFTNGCFDLVHLGHVRFLAKSRAQGDVLVVALNSDASVKCIKGSGRPILSERERCEIIAALACVDLVTTFAEDTPQNIIEQLRPDVLVKGGDWPKDQIVGAQIVESMGGKVVSLDFEKGFSTTNIIERIRKSASGVSRR